jgi:hypothetical protein
MLSVTIAFFFERFAHFISMAWIMENVYMLMIRELTKLIKNW